MKNSVEQRLQPKNAVISAPLLIGIASYIWGGRLGSRHSRTSAEADARFQSKHGRKPVISESGKVFVAGITMGIASGAILSVLFEAGEFALQQESGLSFLGKFIYSAPLVTAGYIAVNANTLLNGK